MTDYSNYLAKDLELNDLLAVDRTELAISRTSLAFLRTAITFFAGGVGFYKFFEEAFFVYTGYIFMTFGAVIFVYGVYKHLIMIGRMRKLEFHRQETGRL